jgi:hypothetical protein
LNKNWFANQDIKTQWIKYFRRGLVTLCNDIIDINSVVKNTHPNIKSTDYNSKFNEVKRIFNKIASNYLVDTPIVSNTNQSIFIPEKPEQEQPEQKQHVNLADETIIKLVRTKGRTRGLLLRQYVRSV